jgi:hypothetical protein
VPFKGGEEKEKEEEEKEKEEENEEEEKEKENEEEKEEKEEKEEEEKEKGRRRRRLRRRRRRRRTFVADNLRISILPLCYQFYLRILFFICIVLGILRKCVLNVGLRYRGKKINKNREGK